MSTATSVFVENLEKYQYFSGETSALSRSMITAAVFESVNPDFCLCLGFTAQSIQWGHVERVSLPNHTFTGQA